MDKISKVKQSLQGMLKKMTQDTEHTGAAKIRGGVGQQEGIRFQKKALNKTTSLEENTDSPRVRQNRRAVSVCDGNLKKRNQVERSSEFQNNIVVKNEDKKVERNLIHFSSEEDGATSQESTPQPEDKTKPKLHGSPFSPRKH